MAAPTDSPFIAFTVITAPAVLTNVTAIMSLTTSNRIIRAVDHARALSAELSSAPPGPPSERERHIHRVEFARNRSLWLVSALGAFQFGGIFFAAATLVALIGTVLHSWEPTFLGPAFSVVSLLCFTVGVGSIITGAAHIVRETRVAHSLLHDETDKLLHALRAPAPALQAIPSAKAAMD
jgi:hypothetical protein